MADNEGAGAEVIIPAETEGAVELVIDKPGEAAAVASPVVAQEPVVAKVAAEPAQKIVTADEGIESLKDQIAKAKAESQQRLSEKDRRIQEAFENARRAELETAEAKKEVLTVKQSAVVTVLDNLKRDKEDARREYVLAAEASDHAKVAEALDKISLANTRIVEAEKGKLELEERAKALPSAPRRQEPLAADDPAERLAVTLSPRSAAWVRSHPEYARDNRMTRKMVRAHEDAVDEGHALDSDSYFDFVNRTLGITKAPVQAADPPDPAREPSRTPASAPVSRDVAQSPSATRPNSVHLNAAEVRTAIDTYSPLYPKASRQELLQKYATDKVTLMKEGKIGRVAS